MAVLGLRFCARAFSSCGKRGPLFIAVRGPLTIAASLVGEHRLQTHRLSNCGSRVQLLRGMWDLPRPRLEPVSPALAGRFSTTVPPGKPQYLLNDSLLSILLPLAWRREDRVCMGKKKDQDYFWITRCYKSSSAEGLVAFRIPVPSTPLLFLHGHPTSLQICGWLSCDFSSLVASWKVINLLSVQVSSCCKYESCSSETTSKR